MPADAKDPGGAAQALALRECRAIRRAFAQRRDIARAIHDARKAIRRLRSVLSLVAGRVDGVDAVDRALARLGNGLSTLRDAHVAIATAQRMAARHAHPSWPGVVAALEHRRDALLARALARDPEFARRRATVGRLERDLARLDWRPVRKRDLRDALQYSQHRVATAAHRAASDPRAEHEHRWRRRARRLRMQLEALLTVAPGVVEAHATPSPRKQIKALARLGDALGWRQDVQVLRGLLARMPGVPERPRLLAALREEQGRQLDFD